jgi:DNA-binding transcriptional ArsR family regulator
MSRKRAERTLTGTAPVFAALGDETRLLLLKRLSQDGPASITALARPFQLTRQGITKHLRILAAAGLIGSRRAGREHIWALNPQRLEEARRHLDMIARGWDEALARLKAFVEKE